jgi:hypothetical protein
MDTGYPWAMKGAKKSAKENPKILHDMMMLLIGVESVKARAG